MLRYLYTNDIRISDLYSKLQNAAIKIYTDTIPVPENLKDLETKSKNNPESLTEEEQQLLKLNREKKSENNNINTLKFYFNLNKDSNCNSLIRDNDVRPVLINFIKKFQFPNPRTRQSFEESKEDQIYLAPFREMLKILYIANLQDGDNGYLTVGEIVDFIFFNKEVAQNKNPDYINVYKQIIQFRIDAVYPDNIYKPSQRFYVDVNNKRQEWWKHSSRQISELLNILEHVNFIKINNNRYSISNVNDLDTNEKAEILEILMTNHYWNAYDFPYIPNAEKKDDKQNLESFKAALIDYNNYFDIKIHDKNKNIDKVDEKLSSPIQKIFFGPPGTGKSYGVTELIKKTYPTYEDNAFNNPYVFRTAIHPEFSYYDFVGNIMPVSNRTENGVEINYEFQKGIFTLALKKAFETDNDVFLVLEEMSRGNIVSVFGEIFQLLDRKDNGRSEYTINIPIVTEILKRELDEWENDGIYLPENLHIIGTVNTSDQNVYVMDTAFKRRFEFEYVETDPVEGKNQFNLTINNQSIGWNNFYPVLNDFIVEKLELSEDKQIGQFFIKFKEDNDGNKEHNNDQLSNKLLQYLWNDVHLVKMTSNNLFRKDLTSFGKLYKQCKSDGFTSIFSSEFKAEFTNKTSKIHTVNNNYIETNNNNLDANNNDPEINTEEIDSNTED